MNFVTGVNRLLRTERIIKGDDDDIADFTDTQHQADIELAQLAIQNQLVECLAEELYGYEEASTSFTLTASTASYSLASDFIRFASDTPFLYDSTNNYQMFEYKGGKNALELHVPNYASQTGDPYAWYLEPDTTKKISVFPTPDSSGKVYTYRYQKDASVTTATDTLPLINDLEAWAFIDAAARRFRFMDMKIDPGKLENDPVYMNAMSRLASLRSHKNPRKRYGKKYG